MSMNKKWLAISLSLVALSLAGCKPPQAKNSNDSQTVVVTTIPARKATVTENLVANGTIIPGTEIKVMPKTAGKIAWAVEEGSRVSAGETIATLELPEMVSQLDVQQASLDMAKTNYLSARSNLERMRTLFKQGGISAQQMDGAETQFKVSSKQVDSAQAAIRAFKTQLANGVITAPFGGIVTARYTDVGGMASPAAPLFNLAKLGKMQVKMPISEKDIGKVRVGLKATLSSAAYPGETFPARISEIAPAIDPASRQLNLKLDVLGGLDRLKLGMFVTAEIACATHPGLLLPAKAVLADGPDSVVFLADSTKAKKVTVNTGVRTGDRVEILSGVTEGADVILGGNNLVKDGDAIQLKSLK
ncbi:MAG: efflux RND transporter periplasmic adaptor subunit [Bacteroidota bacterium]